MTNRHVFRTDEAWYLIGAEPIPPAETLLEHRLPGTEVVVGSALIELRCRDRTNGYRLEALPADRGFGGVEQEVTVGGSRHVSSGPNRR